MDNDIEIITQALDDVIPWYWSPAFQSLKRSSSNLETQIIARLIIEYQLLTPLSNYRIDREWKKRSARNSECNGSCNTEVQHSTAQVQHPQEPNRDHAASPIQRRECDAGLCCLLYCSMHCINQGWRGFCVLYLQLCCEHNRIRFPS